jgi:hypothetical protein
MFKHDVFPRSPRRDFSATDWGFVSPYPATAERQLSDLSANLTARFVRYTINRFGE